jgi:hypothetical protein
LLRAKLPLAEWNIDLEPAIDARLRAYPGALWYRAWRAPMPAIKSDKLTMSIESSNYPARLELLGSLRPLRNGGDREDFENATTSRSDSDPSRRDRLRAGRLPEHRWETWLCAEHLRSAGLILH